MENENIWRIYEERKSELRGKNLDSDSYEKALETLLKELDL